MLAAESNGSIRKTLTVLAKVTVELWSGTLFIACFDRSSKFCVLVALAKRQSIETNSVASQLLMEQ